MEIFLLIMVGICYLMITSGVWITAQELIVIVEIMAKFIQIVAGILGVIFILRTLKMDGNNRGNFIAISHFIMSLFIMLQLVISLVVGEQGVTVNKIISQLMMIGQLLSLFGCLFLISEEKGDATPLYVWLGGLMILWVVGNKFYLDSNVETSLIGHYLPTTQDKIILLGTSILFILGQKRVKEFPVIESKDFKYLLFIKWFEALLRVNSLTGSQEVLGIVESFLQMAYSVVVLLYIDETIYGRAWKKIELDIKDKESALVKGESNRRMLTSAVLEVQKDIKLMMVSVDKLEKVISEKYKSRDIDYIRKIKNNCERLFKLTHNIVTLNNIAQEQPLKFEKVNLTALIEEIVLSMEPYIKRREIKLDFMASNQEIIAEINPESIERILINLLSNATKYNKDKGSIEVRLGQRKDKIFLSVKDTGIGIPEPYLESIFKRFERVQMPVRTKQEGSGLGLAIVKSLVALHQGRIIVASKVNQGTIISISLPMTHPT